MNSTAKTVLFLCGAAILSAVPSPGKSKDKTADLSALDRYVTEAMRSAGDPKSMPGSGSLWSPSSRFSDLALDLRAARVDDLVTIVVSERASALAKGAVKTARSSNARSSLDALLGNLPSQLSNLARLGGESQLDGQGETSRETLLNATLTARVTHVLPNGNLVVEGTKNVVVESENQFIVVRGVVRPVDLSTGNLVGSDRLGQMEIKVNGKGVVGDAIRRPNFLYRLLLGVLPF